MHIRIQAPTASHLLAHLAKSAFVDKLTHSLLVWIAPGDVWLHSSHHIQGGFVDLQPDKVISGLELADTAKKETQNEAAEISNLKLTSTHSISTEFSGGHQQVSITQC